MSAQYLGLCTRPCLSIDDQSVPAARVRLLARIEQNAEQLWFVRQNLTESGTAPVVWIPRDVAPWLTTRLLLVRLTFAIDPRTSPIESSDPNVTVDAIPVSEFSSPETSVIRPAEEFPVPDEITPFGAFILDEMATWRRPLPVPIGTHIQIRRTGTRKLVGPWRVASVTNPRTGVEIQQFEPTEFYDEIAASAAAKSCMQLDYANKNWLLHLCDVGAPMTVAETPGNEPDANVVTPESNGTHPETSHSEDVATPLIPVADLPGTIPRWQEFQENCHPSCLPLLELCCRAGLPPEEVDFEFVDAPEHGIQASAELAWPSRHVAIVRMDQDVDATELKNRSWRVFRVPELLNDLQPLRDLLEEVT